MSYWNAPASATDGVKVLALFSDGEIGILTPGRFDVPATRMWVGYQGAFRESDIVAWTPLSVPYYTVPERSEKLIWQEHRPTITRR